MTRYTKLFVVLLLVLMVLPYSPTTAATYYNRWDAASVNDCTLSTLSFGFTWSWNFPATGGEYSYHWYVNGTSDGGIQWNPKSGSGSTTSTATRFFVNPAPSFPYTLTVVWESYVNGDLLYRSKATFTCQSAGSGTAVIENLDFSGTSGSTSATNPALPGPDMVELPAGSVVGTFTITTPLYFEPKPGAASDFVMDAGKSLWVTGLDASGQFYQVVLSGIYLWVPVGTIGPTSDDVWHGTLLPTQIVE